MDLEKLREEWAAKAEAERVYKTWKPLVLEEMDRVGDRWGNIESIFPSLDVLLTPYVERKWMPDDVAFTIWTRKRVYFPVWRGLYDEGYEVVKSIPRHPTNEAIAMLGDDY